MKPDTDVYDELPYDDQTIEQIRILMHKNMYNPNLLNEIEHMYSNFKGAENSTFPKNPPVIFFIQANHPAAEGWITEHEKQIKDSVHGKVVLPKGGHYLYRSHSKEIVCVHLTLHRLVSYTHLDNKRCLISLVEGIG
ncbi:hypothetical protein P4H66_10200 [Paenibacillus dokdonensis]|uniref:Uncharacterized protein n=1 Tax=Paenibacillus dokdonensis TaxID=2567944 RepID=A0ABU6GKF6_9BACL|nr:hypothetical protein [Paenibacillus dokdonensis]MEC0240219.1 hypothetical protein [Paenibacillus dokdonensis]